MFEQIMSGPFTRTHYILSNIVTIGIIGLFSAALITAVGYPVFFDSVEIRQVISDIRDCHSAILIVANKLTRKIGTKSAETEEENSKKNASVVL